MTRVVLLCVLVGAWLVPSLAFGADYDTEELEINGPWQQRIDIVILGDGYTAGEQVKFKTDAQNLVAYVFNQTPFYDYRAHYNFHLVYVISNESGADMPSTDTYVDTALDATYDAFGLHRLLVVDDYKALQAAKAVEVVDFVFVIVNHQEYGGSGGDVAVTSVHTAAPEVLTHEIGHMFGDLADEYEDAYPGYPAGDAEANVTYANTREAIPWREWIEEDTPIPTPESVDYAGVVGLFEGARYLATGIYRPTWTCRMRVLDVPFCEICSEQLIRSSYTYVSPSDAEGESFHLGPGGRANLDAQLVQSVDHTLVAAWSLDGQAVTTNAGAVTAVAECLGDGEHTVSVAVSDRSPLLRMADALALAKTSVSWTVTVADVGEADPEACEWPLPPDGDVDGDVADGDEPDGDFADGDLDADADEVTDGDLADGDAVDGDVPSWWPDGDLPEDGDETGSGGDGGGCAQGGPAAPLVLLLLGLALLRRRAIN